MFKLHFNNQIFQSKEDFEVVDEGYPKYAKAALSFCKSWILGQSTFIQQTSGSTGSPKKIELARFQMLASAEATGVFFQTNSNSLLLCCLNPDYIAGKMMLVRAMVWNCQVWVVEPKANPLSDLPEEALPDFIAMVPLQVESCMVDAESLSKLQKIANLIIGGAPISDNLKKSLVENNIHAWQTYGMTETVSHIALAKIGKDDFRYQTLPGVEIGQDYRGTLWVKSPMSGPQKIQTNDLIDMTSKTSFKWHGRVDFAVNSGGIKLHPEQLEQKAQNVVHEYFPDCRFFFFGEKDTKLGERLVLILEGNFDQNRAKDLIQKLGTILEKYEVPKAIYFSPKFVLTPSGKVNRYQTYQTL